jgi:hypothetical protein
MRTTTQLDHDLFRILLFRRDASELLLETDGESLQLPTTSIPKHARVAEQLTKALKDEWGLDAYCLFPVCEDGSPGTSVPCHVAELGSTQVEAPATMRWLPTISLSPTDFRDQVDFTGIQASLAKFDQFRRGRLPGAFGTPGWLRTVTEWVAAQAGAVGLSLTGNFRQFNSSQTFSLLRFETDGSALWFKAVGAPNVHEFSITLFLARLLQGFVPRVIASHPDWNAWLSLEAEGAHLSDTTPLNAWRRAATTLAHLQIASCGHGLHLIDAGCRDIRVRSLLPLVDPFFERMAELMELQTKPSPLSLARAEIRALAAEIRSSLEELNACQIPDVICHLDFNPRNVLVSPERCVFLDWAEGSVGHPFFTLQYLLELWRRFHSTEIDTQKALVSEYLFAWQTFAASHDIEKSLVLMPLLAAFAYATALGWNNPDARHYPIIAGYLRSLARRMMREVDALRERRALCAP